MAATTQPPYGHCEVPSRASWKSVCLLEVVSIQWIPLCPWTRTQQASSSGSGFCISGRRIMTNAHVVANAIDIRVRLHGSAKRYLAKVAVYGPDVDLAVVEIEPSVADDFWASIGDNARGCEFSDRLPALQETVRALGFPTGGRTICVTEGVVSRVDSIELTPPADSTLVIQIDAAINPGNSGGPVFDAHGHVTGVAFCKDARSNADNIGYVIPAQVVKTFLTRCDKCTKRGDYVLSPTVPYRWHKLENSSLRAAHKVPEGVTGVLLTSVAPAVREAIRPKDVLVAIDGHRIADDGQVCLRGDELIQHRYLIRGKAVGDQTVFTVFRDGKEEQTTPVEMGDLQPICPRWADVDYLPEYLILGALALVPLAQGHHWYKDCPTEIKSRIDRWNRTWPGDREGKEQLILMVAIFAHELTFGYSRSWRIVERYNDENITSLRHLRDMWHETRKQVEALPKDSDKRLYVRLGMQNDDDIILDAALAMEAEPDVLKTHAIEKASFIEGDAS
eukprot:TRINITY_DN25242_c0_g1_i1.p1 TRINITY_DN25242_c0_g1~~TRINITY_DN25242_c0_g1_i1.p1  ORF type:complete len:505 (-),score=95.62 TRINITY_DN25242_c0_g1_i1:143-1657(-)